MARSSGLLVMTGSKDREYSMIVEFSDDLIMPHQLRKGGYYKGQKTCTAMIDELRKVSGLQSAGGEGNKPEITVENIATASTHELRNVELQSATESPKQAEPGFKLSVSFKDDNMSDSGLTSELVDADPSPLRRLLANIYEFVVIIEDLEFECHSYPFVLKSSYFKNSIQDFKNKIACSEHKFFPRQERPIHEIRLILPGGSRTFELIRNFCYDSWVPITYENVLSLFTASNYLGFTEDVAPDNLHSRCQRFIAKDSKNHGVQGILSMLVHSTTDDATDHDLLVNKLAEHDRILVINKLAELALAFQNSHDENTREIVELLSEITKLHPRFVDATLREFERLGVNMVDFFWCTDLSTNLDLLLGCDEDSHTNGRSIFSYFSEALDKCIAAGEVQIDRVDPKKLVMLLNPGVFRRPMLSEDAIKAYVSSKLSHMEAEDILDLHPRVVKDLVSTAVSESRNSMFIWEELQHLAGLVDRVLVLEAERNPWDGSTDSKENFKEMAECVPLNERESHDSLYDAVESFSQSFTQEEADGIWEMVDLDKLSEAKFEDAINFTLSRSKNYYVRLLRRRQDNHLSLKRNLSVVSLFVVNILSEVCKLASFPRIDAAPLEENESKRKSGRISDYCGTLFTIFVRALDGTLLSFLVESDTTVNIIREEIAKTESIYFERFWWPVYRGKKLLESHTIASYGIQKDCTLYIKVLLFDEPDQKFLTSSLRSSLGPSPDPESSHSTSVPTEFYETLSACVCGCT